MRRGICPARNRKGRSQMTTESQLKGWLEADSASTSTVGPSLIPPSWRDVERLEALTPEELGRAVSGITGGASYVPRRDLPKGAVGTYNVAHMRGMRRTVALPIIRS